MPLVLCFDVRQSNRFRLDFYKVPLYHARKLMGIALEHDKLNMRHLRAFREVASCKSMSEASRRIFLSQPALSQAIAKLEEHLGVQLFERRRRGMFTTEVGEIFLNRVERALDLVRRGAIAAHNLERKKNGQQSAALLREFDHQVTTVQLRAHVAVADSANFSMAAKALDITQPSLHRAARDLERLAGVTFYNKARYGIELTPGAMAFALQIRLAFAELAQGLSEVEAWRGMDKSEIVVGSMPLALSYVLPNAIEEHLQSHPDTTVRVVSGPYKDLLHGLRHGTLDFLIGALRSHLPVEDVAQQELFAQNLVFAVRADHPLVMQEKPDVETLRAYSWIVPAQGTPARGIFDAMFQTMDVLPPAHVVETSSLILTRNLLLDSDRVAVVSPYQMALEVRMGLIRFVPFPVQHTSRPIGLTFRRDWRPTATQAAFLECVRKVSAQVDLTSEELLAIR